VYEDCSVAHEVLSRQCVVFATADACRTMWDVDEGEIVSYLNMTGGYAVTDRIPTLGSSAPRRQTDEILHESLTNLSDSLT
jgi:hypothetical protein